MCNTKFKSSKQLQQSLTVQNQLNNSLIAVNVELEKTESSLHEANAELLCLATTDGLTCVGNRRAFDDYLKLEWAKAKRKQQKLSLIMIDIRDFFKAGYFANNILLYIL